MTITAMAPVVSRLDTLSLMVSTIATAHRELMDQERALYDLGLPDNALDVHRARMGLEQVMAETIDKACQIMETRS